MIQIRNSIFETNSSSVHSITMCSENEFKEWEKGNVLYCTYVENFVSYDDAVKTIKKDHGEDCNPKEYFKDYDFYTVDMYNDMVDDRGYEEFYEKYVTQHGDTVIAFGYSGNDY